MANTDSNAAALSKTEGSRWFFKRRIEGLWWIDVLSIIILLPVCLVCLFWIEPFHPFFTERDPTISYPKEKSTFPFWEAVILAVIVPAVYMILISIVIKKKEIRVANPSFNSPPYNILVFAVNLLVTETLTEFGKVYAGRLRPNFFALCNYQGYADALASGDLTEYFSLTTPGKPADYSLCRNEPKEYLDGFKSFPSGHSSTAFSGLVYISLFTWFAFASKKNLLARLIGCLIPIMLAMAIAISRMRNYWHAPVDVVAGCILGAMVAIAVFSVHYYDGETSHKYSHMILADDQSYEEIEAQQQRSSTMLSPSPQPGRPSTP